ncbi:MAG: hypothetical protein ACP5EQ_07880 [Candidatus Cloacimonadia bacterium]
MPEWPHEYIVRSQVDEDLFVEFIHHIRSFGYEGRFYNKPIIYFDFDDMTYWTMGAPINETIIINRCKKKDTFAERLNSGCLPDK